MGGGTDRCWWPAQPVCAAHAGLTHHQDASVAPNQAVIQHRGCSQLLHALAELDEVLQTRCVKGQGLTIALPLALEFDAGLFLCDHLLHFLGVLLRCCWGAEVDAMVRVELLLCWEGEWTA